MLTDFLSSVQDGNMIAPKRMAAELRIPMTELAKMARVNRNTLATKAGSAAVQAGLGTIARIISKASDMAGDERSSGSGISRSRDLTARPPKNWSSRAAPET
jgi:hypothetical protein